MEVMLKERINIRSLQEYHGGGGSGPFNKK